MGYEQEQYCINCGEILGKASRSDFGDPPRGKRISKGGFAGILAKVYYVCGDRCAREYEKANEHTHAHESDSKSSRSTGGSFVSDIIKEDSPELIVAKAEAERIKAEQYRIEKEENRARREEKAGNSWFNNIRYRSFCCYFCPKYE